MPSWFSKPDGPQYRIFFATDVHGSEPTFRKFINAAKAYGVDALILGGDISGKMLIPIIDLGRGKYTATLQGNTISMSTDELTAFEKKLAALGFYFGVMDQPQYDRCVQDASEVDRLFLEKAGERLTGWIRLAEERLAGTDVRCYITGGNDDHNQLVDLLQREARGPVVACENQVIALQDDYLMVSLGYSNPTPWKTPREITEEELRSKIEQVFEGVEDCTKVVFNMHVPPVDSTLDTCPMLDTSTDPPTVISSGGEPVMFGAGSPAVADAIKKYQPLLSLHGHIHESRGVVKIGRTTAVNPGSEYGEGILRGAIINLQGDRVKNAQLTSG